MPIRSPRVPSYRLHKATGQALVQVHGRRIYLGKYDTPESRQRYARIVADYLANPAKPLPARKATGSPMATAPGLPLVCEQLAAAYWTHAERYYVTKDGRPTSQQAIIRAALKALRATHASTPVDQFGPLALQSVQNHLLLSGQCRNTINKLTGVLKAVFKWGVKQELVPPSVHHGLSTVGGLPKWRTTARETEPVGPVDGATVDATLPFLPPIVADMVRFQRLTGARPSEVCLVRPMDLDRSGEVWTYTPRAHKTEHHGKGRTVYIGPQAQAVLMPYLLRAADAYCFSPADGARQRLTDTRATGRRKPRPKRQPGQRYDRTSYRRAVSRAVIKANEQRGKEGLPPLPAWHPNQLRHTAATEIRRQFGLEAAQVILGHSKADVTQVYAERDTRLAADVVRKIG